MIDETKVKLHEEELWKLFSLVSKALIQKISSDKAKSYDFNNAIDFLKMNGITLTHWTHEEVGNQLVRLHEEGIDLPFKVIDGVTGEKKDINLKTHEFM